MAEQEIICPYPGLRSFTEEESLYFKGRDMQIGQISDLLEQNKFLMLTGASGEGKSSLIYAGLIPNARAGFFKAHYTNWVVADFRPERSPVSNMAQSIALALGLDKETVATELKRGFSSLIDLYVNSNYFIDEQDLAWKELSDQEKKEKKRSAANLMIIVDQFEEFFTNPENFSNEIPSQDSQIVVNLALETARIAMKRNLPVYVVCTMRSDFIGQCVAFRGLPEYIGFSQFFVPRLKRKDFKQVIEEPAILSGNRISQRLIERVVYDLAEGVDQLPVLQHALSQIWLAANRGTEEMDLIHYAMVGGMPAVDLPDQDQAGFNHWFENQPEFKKKFFQQTGLHKIIEFHANTLYEGAWEQYMALHPDQPITVKDSKRIIAMAFACLTKIDNSRAVRNRMTLGEITDIINDERLPAETVSNVLTIFREEANSFIRPYKTNDPVTHRLSRDSVLDITHEALIRNWDKLNQWALKEFEFYSTWLDFKKQLGHWIASGKSSGYLLPIGPLTFFETWYKQCKPNIAWIARYTEHDSDALTTKEQAAKILSDTKEFLRVSARKVIVSRAFMKYGTQRVTSALAIVIMLVLSGFYWNDAENKRNERVIERISNHARTLMASEDVSSTEKATYLIVQERYQPGSLMPFLKDVKQPKSKIIISIDAYFKLLEMDNHFNLPVKAQLYQFIEKELLSFTADNHEDAFLIRQINRYLVRLVYDNYYNQQVDYRERTATLAALLKERVTKFYSNTKLFEPAIATELNMAIQFWLTLKNPDGKEISDMLVLISPFEGTGGDAFKIYYTKGSFEPTGKGFLLAYGGGYHTLASLYAALGNSQKIVACFEILKEQPEYFTTWFFNNYNNIIGYLYQYGHREKVDDIIKWLSKNYETDTPQAVYKNILNRSGYLSRHFHINFTRELEDGASGFLHMNLFLSSREQFHLVAEDYVKILNSLPNPAERNFQLAMHYKRLAMFEHKYAYDRGLEINKSDLYELFDKAWYHFNLVSADHLEKIAKPLTVPYYSFALRYPQIKNRHLFIYPDYLEGWFSRTYHTDLFYHYLEEKKLLGKYFNDEQDLNYIHLWLAKTFEVNPDRPYIKYHNPFPLSDETLDHVAGFLISKGSDANLPYIILANRYFDKADSLKGIEYYAKIDFKTFYRSADRFDYLEKTFALNQLENLSRNLAGQRKHKEAMAINNLFKFNRERAFGFIFDSERLYGKNYNPMAFSYLDSALRLMKKEDFSTINVDYDYRFKLVTLLGRIGGEKLNALSRSIVQDLSEGNKFNGITSNVSGIASEGNYFAAVTAMPSTLTETQELICYYYLLWEACKLKESGQVSPWKAMDDYFEWDQEYIFFTPPFG